MSASHPSFPTCNRYVPTTATVAEGASLPPNSYIDGKLVVVFDPNDARPEELRIRISSKQPYSTMTSDYVHPSSNRRVKWKLNITLLVTDDVKTTWPSVKEAMLDERERLRRCFGEGLRLMTDGMVIKRVDGIEVDIEAKGSRLLWTEKAGAWTIFQGEQSSPFSSLSSTRLVIQRLTLVGTTQSSSTPSWLRSPSIYTSSPSSPPPIVPSKQPVQKSIMRPVTAHIPTKLSMRPMESAFISAAEKRKVSDSPSNTVAESSTSGHRVVKKHLTEFVHSSKSSEFPARQPLATGRQAEVRPSSSIAQGSKPMNRVHSLDAPMPIGTNDGSHPSRQMDEIVTNTSPVHVITPVLPTSTTHFVHSHITQTPDPDHPGRHPLPRANSVSIPRGNPRAEAEAAARAEASRGHALQMAQQELERVRLDSLGRGLALAVSVPVLVQLIQQEIKYTSLKDARDGSFGNIMGIVLEASQPKSTRKGKAFSYIALEAIIETLDFTLSVVITDPSTYTGDASGEDMVITIFRPSIAALPADLPRGTPILFRQLKVCSSLSRLSC